MGRFRLVVANSVSRMTPRTRAFAIRRALFSWAGIDIHTTARLAGGTTFDNTYASIGSDTWIGGGCRIIGGPGAPIVVERDCDLGPEVLLVSGSHTIGPSLRRAGAGVNAPIHIGAGTWIGARAVLLAGVTVGPGSVLAAGAVVSSDIPANTLAGGVPARSIRVLEQD